MLTLVKNPFPRLTKRRFLSVLLLFTVVSAITVPAALYWALQRSDLHQRWQIEANYASQFSSQMGYAAALMAGVLFKWNNATSSFAGNEMGSADLSLVYISNFDTTHANQLQRIDYALENVRPTVFGNLTYSQRTALSAELRSLSVKIENAYWNFLNYTSASPTSGPPFWYSRPSPPDEGLLRDAVNIALSLQS